MLKFSLQQHFTFTFWHMLQLSRVMLSLCVCRLQDISTYWWYIMRHKAEPVCKYLSPVCLRQLTLNKEMNWADPKCVGECYIYLKVNGVIVLWREVLLERNSPAALLLCLGTFGNTIKLERQKGKSHPDLFCLISVSNIKHLNNKRQR